MILKKGVCPFLMTIIHFATAFVGENYPAPTLTQEKGDFGGVVAVLFGVAIYCVAVDADAAYPIIEADGVMFYAHNGSMEQALEVGIVAFATILVVYSLNVASIRQENTVIGDFGDVKRFLEGDRRFGNFHCYFLPV